MKIRNLLVSSLSLMLVGTVATAERLPTKQLAGPIEEARTGVMAEVNPIETAIHSKSAMIPVDLIQNEDGTWGWNGSVAVDDFKFNMMLFSGSDSWNVSMQQPFNKSLTPAHWLGEMERSSLGMGNASFEGDYYRFSHAMPGEWNVNVQADAPLGTQGYLLYSTEGPYRMLSYKTTNALLVGNDIGFVTYGFEKVAEGHGIEPNNGMIEQAFIRVTTPDGAVETYAMYDDGLHGDEVAGDNVFGGSFAPTVAGEYHAQVVAQGTTPDGFPFVRTAEHLVPVLAPTMKMARNFAVANVVDDKRLNVSLPIENFEGAPEKYRVFAEVWGTDANGEMKAVNWIGGMSYVDNGSLNLGLDMRWLGMAGTVAGFELRNVRIEDPDHFIPVQRLDRLAVFAPALPPIARTLPKSGITDEMLQGPKPVRGATKAGVLMLVHGYCSGNAWGPQTGQFTGEVLFLDTNKNRSHDQFANLIGSFGSSYSSFGIVAHSQGGAAGLHLYTYYWSGLDYASSGRLIQSVGTPYQGTALAGNAAVLGQLFGAGCGSNYDLTYSGASNWLSGVPSWARNKVNYYTTAFKDNWWSYDYCHLATDLLLNDPDDGTTEKSKGQLSSAYNRGHKSGWCHTGGMAEPAQTTDGSRNSQMNSYAAR